MTRLRLDKVIVATAVDTFLNYSSPASTLVISGSLAIAATQNFTTTISVSRTKSIADVYATNRNTGKKMSLIAGSIHNPYQATGLERNPCNVSYSGGVITITLTVDNTTGAPITLVTQTWDILAVLKEVAFSGA